MIGICYVGTVKGLEKYARPVFQKAAMRGDNLADPTARKKIQRELRQAEMRDLRQQILSGRFGGDAA